MATAIRLGFRLGFGFPLDDLGGAVGRPQGGQRAREAKPLADRREANGFASLWSKRKPGTDLNAPQGHAEAGRSRWPTAGKPTALLRPWSK